MKWPLKAMRTAGQSQSIRKKTTTKYSCEYLKGERMKFKHTPKRMEKARTVLLTGQLQTRWSGTTQPNSKEAGAICSGLFFTAQFCAVRQKKMVLARFTVYANFTIYTMFTVHNCALYTVDRVAIMCYNTDSGKEAHTLRKDG